MNWKHDKNIYEYIDDLILENSIIKILKDFYQLFRSTLVNLEREKLISIMESNYECNIVRKFVKNLKTDYNAVANSATYKMNNGIVEGNVNKVKVIKRDMYGRALVGLLRAKVIYQSHFL
ncbi:MAG: transposase [Halanaerobiales bacterium]|nr:transposase [Halanaerobiales bacterium]